MKNKFEAFLNCEPKEIKATVTLSPILSPKDFNSLEKAAKSRLGYLILNTEEFTFIKCPRGSNWAAELVPLLKSTDCKRIIFLGALGGLADNLKIGDLVVGETAQIAGSLEDWIMDSWSPTFAKASAGKLDTPPTPASSTLLKKTALPKGKIASIPLIVKETDEKLKELKELGFIGIEMESGPLYLACQKEGLEVIGIYVISDLPLSRPFYAKDFTFPKTDKLIGEAKKICSGDL